MNDPILQWASYIGDPRVVDSINGVAYDTSNNVFVCGNTISSGFNISGYGFGKIDSSQDGFIAKFNNSGVIQWGKLFSGASIESATAIQTHPNDTITVYGNVTSSGFTISGTSINKTNISSDVFVVQYNQSGNVLWGELIGGLFNETSSGALAYDSCGNVIVGGLTSSSGFSIQGNRLAYNTSGIYLEKADTRNSAFIAAFNPSGVYLWGRLLGDNRVGGDATITTITCDSFNNVYAGGRFDTSGLNSSGINFGKLTFDWSPILVKYNSSGIIQYGRTFGSGAITTSNDRSINSIEVDSDSVYLSIVNTTNISGVIIYNACGLPVVSMKSNNPTGSVIKVRDTDGICLWGFSYDAIPTNTRSRVNKLKLTSDGLYVAGSITVSGFSISGTSINTSFNAETTILALYNTTSGLPVWGRTYGTVTQATFMDFVNNQLLLGGTTVTSGFALNLSYYKPNNIASLVLTKRNTISGLITDVTNIYGDIAQTLGQSIAKDINNNIYIVGQTSQSGLAIPGTNIIKNTTTADTFFVRYNPSGVATLGGLIPTSSSGFIKADNSGSIYLVVGTAASPFTVSGTDFNKTNTTTDLACMKLNASGQIVWNFLIGGSGSETTASIDIDSQNDLYLTGLTTTSGFTITTGSSGINFGKTSIATSMFYAKFNSTSGIIQWGSLLNQSGSISFPTIRVDSLQNTIIAGVTATSGLVLVGNVSGINLGKTNSSNDIFFMKLNTFGIGVWGQLIGGSGSETFQTTYSMTLNAIDNSIYIGGITTTCGFTIQGTNLGKVDSSTDGFVARFNTNATLMWAKLIGGLSTEIVTSLDVNTAGECFVTGNTITSGFSIVTTPSTQLDKFNTSADTFFVKYDGGGTATYANLLYNVTIGTQSVFTNDGFIYTLGSISTSGFNHNIKYYTTDGFVQSYSLLQQPPLPPLLNKRNIRPVCRPSTIQFWWEANPSTIASNFRLVCDGINGISTFTQLNTFQITGLNDGSTYSNFVSALNNTGESDPSFFRTVQPGLKPDPPINPNIITTSSNSALISWSPPPILPSATIKWYLVKDLNTNMRYNTIGINNSINIRDLSPGPHQFTIAAINDPGYSTRISTTTINI